MLWQSSLLRRTLARPGLILAFVLVGCSTTAGDAATSSESESNGETDSTGESESGSGETGDAPLTGVCRLGCNEAADCCPVGSINCPGDYPNNWACEAGLCELPGCQTNEQCAAIGNFADIECHPIAGTGSCFVPCEADADCVSLPDASCSGVADDGARFCLVESLCQTDADCAGEGRCDPQTGACGCHDDDDCTASGLVCNSD